MIKSLLRPIFRLVTRVYDPVFEREIHGASMFLPISHGLARCVRAHPFYDTALPAWCRFVAERLPVGQKLQVIDVGANVGDTAALVAYAVGPSRVSFICIEADPAYLPLLSRNTKRFDARLFDVALGETTDTRNVQIVHARRGTTSLSEGGAGSSMKTMRLDDLLAESAMVPDVLKIDTDGFEGPILRGATRTLNAHGPSIFMEFSPWHLETYGRERPTAVLSALGEAGYKSAIVYDNEGYPMGQYSLGDAFVNNLSTYCSRRPNFYVDVLASKDEAVLSEFYQSEQARYPIVAWVEHE